MKEVTSDLVVLAPGLLAVRRRPTKFWDWDESRRKDIDFL
jgi:hypothetical protein